MNGIQLGWIDFSKEQRNKVLSVINLLSEPGAVDELGIGIIRDAFANIFFPGTSTIQTRAKYFLIVPYLLNELDREKNMGPKKMMNRLHEQELDIIDILKQSGESGVIGETAGRKLKRKPSEIYWNGIRTYGIFTEGKLSLYDYVRVSSLLREKKNSLKAQGNGNRKEDENDGDDRDAGNGEFSGGFWKLPAYPGNWRENLSIQLTHLEAEFLKDQIQQSVPDSMLGWILKENVKEIVNLNHFDDLIVLLDRFPDQIQADYLMAKAFADFVYGTHIRYNMILSKGKDEKINQKWQVWNAEIQKHASLDLHFIVFERLKVKKGKLIKFLLDCQNAMKNNKIENLDEIIIQRERRLKGDKRSKLYHATEFEYTQWVGIEKLEYRLRNGKNLLEDIFEGLGT
jgi:hypothetical protein